MTPARLVLNTNVILSAALRLGSTPHRALFKARMEAELLASEETLAELNAVLMRPKFDRKVDRALRESLFHEYSRQCTMIEILSSIRACRDPRDDKFLEVAVHGGPMPSLPATTIFWFCIPFRESQF